MKYHHPFEWLSVRVQKIAFMVSLALMLFTTLGLQLLNIHLNTDVAPFGIVSFELAGNLSLSQKIIESWGTTGQIYAGLNLGLDYLFIITYISVIGLACVLVARKVSQRIKSLSFLGILFAWGQIIVALLDSVENYALIKILLRFDGIFWPVLAKWCAIPKFLILAVSLLYLIIGTILSMVVRKR